MTHQDSLENNSLCFNYSDLLPSMQKRIIGPLIQFKQLMKVHSSHPLLPVRCYFQSPNCLFSAHNVLRRSDLRFGFALAFYIDRWAYAALRLSIVSCMLSVSILLSRPLPTQHENVSSVNLCSISYNMNVVIKTNWIDSALALNIPMFYTPAKPWMNWAVTFCSFPCNHVEYSLWIHGSSVSFLEVITGHENLSQRTFKLCQ